VGGSNWFGGGGKREEGRHGSIGEGMVGMGTVAGDVSVLVFGNGEERGPAGKVLVVEVEVVVLGEGIEVCEIHVKEVLRAERAEGRHCGGRVLKLGLVWD